MKQEYDISTMNSRPNPFAKQLKQQVTLPLGIDVIEYFEAIAQEKGMSCQELIILYLLGLWTKNASLRNIYAN
ncbi:MAG: antitoxin [Symploca sp. SIO3E6]|nr:antitoxin [Caldora sp. SIO3E6]